MNKWLTLMLSILLVFVMATVSMASVSVSGEVQAKYDFEDANDDHNGNDLYEGKINFDAKVNDAVTAKIVYKYANAKNGVPDDAVKVDEYWFKVVGDLGTLQVGRWEYKALKGSLDVIDSAYATFATQAAINYVYKADAISFYIWYAADETLSPGSTISSREGVEDNAYIIGASYAGKEFGGDINFVNTETPVGNEETGYAVNLWVVPVSTLKLYANLAEDQRNDETQILGIAWTPNNSWILRGEYDLDEKYEGNVSIDNPWGYYIQFTDANKLIYKYTRKDNGRGLTDSLTSEFKVTVKF